MRAHLSFLGLVVVVASLTACKDAVPPGADGGTNAGPGGGSGTGTATGTPTGTGAPTATGAPTTTTDAGGGGPTDAGSDAATPTPSPALGAHALGFQRYHAPGGLGVIGTPAMSTATVRRSTIVVSVGRGAISAFVPPTDNKNAGAYPQLGANHAYTFYPNSGTALYALTGAMGGAGHVVSAATPTDDELTIAAVEVLDGKSIQDFKWNEVLSGNPITSLSVTTTGPATLVAFWWGDADSPGDKTAVPNNGFVVVDSILQAGSLVQCAAATKTVSAAGTYNVTWTSTPVQGAQLWLAAVQ